MPEQFDLTAAAPAPLAVDAGRRVISGLIVPYATLGHTSAGPTVFAAGSITIPADMGRVKLLEQHDGTPAAVGYMISATAGPAGIQARFKIPEGAAGDAALANAAHRTREGLSVGAQILAHYRDEDDVLVVTAAELFEVSLVTIPAFSDARVLEIAANRKDRTMPNDTQTPAPDTAPEPVQDPTEPTTEPATEPAPAVTVNVQASRVEPQAGPIVPARTNGPVLTLTAAAKMVADGLRDDKSPHAIAAALNDIVPADDGGLASFREQWVGKVWNASQVRRPLIDALGTPKALTSLSVLGWAYDLDNLPEVDVYAGNKTAIPTNDVKTIPATANAVRWAGGWDVDRAYIDLGDPAFIADVFQMATDDYRRKSETYVRAQLLAAATVVVGSATLTAALAALGSAAGQLGAELSVVQFAPDVWSAFTEMSGDDAPWWLRAQGAVNLGTTSGNAGGIQFSVGVDLPAGTILALDGRAASWYEKTPPVRAQALNIPNGGIDIGVFGYGALLIHDKRAIMKTTVTPAAGVAARTTTAKA